jgi:hypothetical protein
MTIQSIKSTIEANNALSLLLLSRINFNSGLEMMKKLREDEKARMFKTEDAIRANDTEAADAFESMCPQTQKTKPLDQSVNLVLASLILANEVQGDNLDFLKSGIRTPKMIIRSQMDWMADKEAKQRLMTAQKFGLQVSVDKFLASIKAKQSDKFNAYVTEAQSAHYSDILRCTHDDLVNIVEEQYNDPKWKHNLEQSCVSLYESAAKRIEEGKFADLPDEVIEVAKEVLARK